jgi:3-phenylpropionate/trans-cinnamate dioxygenase ferredoxin component
MTFRSTRQAAPPEGELTAVDLDGAKIAVAHVQGRLYAFQDACTHLQCSLSGGDLEGACVVCPCHLGRFDVTTGAVVDGPPLEQLRTWPARLIDGLVELDT